MTCSKNLGRLLQASCLGLIGMLTVVGCGGSESPAHNDAAPTDGGGGGSTGAQLNVDKASVNLGSADLNKPTTPGTVTVTNTGKAASGTIVVSAGAGLTTSGCTGTLVAGASCALTITATPTQLGVVTSSVSISANPGALTPLQVSVSYTGTQPGQFSVTPTSIDLGGIKVGVAAPKQTITVTAQVALSDLAVALNGADISSDSTSTCTAALAAAASCTVVINFTAATSGAKSDTVTISAGGINGKSVTVPVSATALKPAALVIDPSSPQTFSTTVGVPSSALNFGVTNSGDVTTGPLSVTITGANKGDFTATATGCTVLGTLGTCTISVVFTPAAAGTAETANLVVADTTAGGPSVTVVLNGTPYPPSALTITPAASDLGTALVGTTGTPVTFTITNSGGTASGALTVALSTTDAVLANDTCTGTSLATAGTCTVSVALKPATAGAKTLTLTVTPAGGSPAVKTLTGTGVSAAGLSANPAAPDFGSIRINNTSQAQTVTVKNNGGTATGALTIIKGGNFGDFPLASNTCSAALAPAATCTFSLTFAPTLAGSRAATYTVTDGTVSVTVSASGVAQDATGLTIDNSVTVTGTTQIASAGSCTVPEGVTATTPCFNDTVVAGTFTLAPIYVAADSPLPAGLTDTGAITTALGGANAADFAIKTNGCTAPLVAGATCPLTLSFTPSAPGARQAVLTVTSANGGSALLSIQANGLAIVEIKPLTLTDEQGNTITGLDFGQVTLLSTNTAGHTRQFETIVRGPSTTTVHTTTVTVSLTDPSQPADFSISTQGGNVCNGATLDFSNPTAAPVAWSYSATPVPNFTCTFTVKFYPQSSEGNKTATLAASGSGGGTDSKDLTGVAAGALTFSPSPAAFANAVQVGDSTNTQSAANVTILSPANVYVTLSNNSASTDEGPISITLTGTNANQFQIVEDLCSTTTLAHATGSCIVGLAFLPTAVGAQTATLTATAGTETASVVINGTATTAYPITVTPNPTPLPYDFGTVVQSVTTWTTFTVNNPTGAPMTNQVTYSITNDSDSDTPEYILANGTNHALGTCGLPGSTSVASGGNCTIIVGFVPGAADPVGTAITGDLSVSADGGNSSVDVSLTGKPSSQLTISPTTYAFPNTAQGTTSTATTLVVSNVGTTALTLSVTGSTALAPFNIDQSSGCAASSALAAGQSCNLVATFVATGAVGTAVSKTLSVTAASSAALASVKLTGTPVAPAQLIAVGFPDDASTTPDQNINLGSVRIGNQSGDVTLQFQNTGSVATSALHYKWSTQNTDTPDPDLKILSEATTGCVGLTSLGPNQTCTVTVHFAASANSTSRTGTGFTLSADQGGSVAIFEFTATVLPATGSGWIAASSGSQAFFVFPGMTVSPGPVSQVFQFTNATANPVVLATSPIAVTTSNNPDVANSNAPLDWAVQTTTTSTISAGSNPCGAIVGGSIPAGGTCTFAVVFAPTAWQKDLVYRWATVTVGTSTLGVFGTVQSPALLTLTPALTDFGQVVVGTASPTQSFTVTNSGQTASAAITITVVGPAAALYTVAGNCNAALAPNGTCTGTIAVTPSAIGLFSNSTTGGRTANGASIQATDGTVSSGTAQQLTVTGVYNTTLSLSPTSVTFGNQAIGTTSAAQPITVSNAASALTSGVISATLADATNFTIVPSDAANDCVTGTSFGGATTPAGILGSGSCTVAVAFKPQSLGTGTGGAFSTTLTLVGAPGGTKVVQISATAVSALSINKTSPQVVNGTTGPLVVTVSLAGNAPTTPYVSTSITGNFVVTKDECAATKLTGGDSCQITVMFTGAAATPAQIGTLTVNGGAGATATLGLTSSSS